MKKIALIILLSCIFFASNSSLAHSASEIILKISGIDGESFIEGHENGIDILAWSWGIINNTENMGDSSSVSDQTTVKPLVVTKYIDKASPDLALKVLTGEFIDEAILVVRKTGESPLDYLKITMSNVEIVNFSTGGSGGEDRLTESISMIFSKVCYEYTPQEFSGEGGAAIEVCRDNTMNTKFEIQL